MQRVKYAIYNKEEEGKCIDVQIYVQQILLFIYL